jgi:hypothetical protein
VAGCVCKDCREHQRQRMARRKAPPSTDNGPSFVSNFSDFDEMQESSNARNAAAWH